jgi:histidinol-phosphate aminotransferase
MKLRIPHHIATLVPYPPGKPLEELEREYGITDSIKLASNENPLGPSPRALAAIREALSRLHRYPDGSGYYLRRRLSDKLSVPFAGIVLGNGSNEIIDLVIRAFLQPGDEVVLPAPSFLVYQLAVQGAGGKPVAVPLRDFHIDLEAMLAAVTARTRAVFVNNPNNPTGTTIRRAAFDRFLDALPPTALVVLDEAYIEFCRDPDTPYGLDYIARGGPAVVVLRTFSKAYGLAGLRIGYGAMPEAVADCLNRVRQPFNTGTLAQIGALAALDDDAFLAQTRQTVWAGLDDLQQGLTRLGIRWLPTQANFILLQVPRDAKEIAEAMLRRGVIVRAMNAYGLPGFIRINAGTHAENDRFLTTFASVLAELAPKGAEGNDVSW